MNGGYLNEPDEAGKVIPEAVTVYSNVMESISELIDSDEINSEKLIELCDRSVALYKSLLEEEDLEKILGRKLEHKIKMINHISINLRNKYNIKFGKQAHDDSHMMNQLILLLTTISVVQCIINVLAFESKWLLPVGLNALLLVGLLLFYFQRYRPYDTGYIDSYHTDPPIYCQG
ncbi:MAG: hypothetical protein U9Q68_05645 [Euryarchaeota archaeon]|nr:hypothetical protein [Euryarchaeota archaeon]